MLIDPEGGVNSKFREEIDDSFNADANSLKDYFLVVSGGRLEVKKAATLGTYEAKHAGELTDGEEYYRNGKNFDCDAGAEFNSSTNALHAEALLNAEDGVRLQAVRHEQRRHYRALRACDHNSDSQGFELWLVD